MPSVQCTCTITKHERQENRICPVHFPVKSDAVGNIASRIVARIVSDLTDRGGLRQEWDGLHPETQAEIIEAWEQIVREEDTAP